MVFSIVHIQPLLPRQQNLHQPSLLRGEVGDLVIHGFDLKIHCVKHLADPILFRAFRYEHTQIPEVLHGNFREGATTSKPLQGVCIDHDLIVQELAAHLLVGDDVLEPLIRSAGFGQYCSDADCCSCADDDRTNWKH